MSETSQTNDQEREPTPEEVAAMRGRLVKYYRDQNELLTIQSEYEKHLADIAESKCRAYMYTVKFAQMTMGSKKEAEDNSSEEAGLKTNSPELNEADFK